MKKIVSFIVIATTALCAAAQTPDAIIKQIKRTYTRLGDTATEIRIRKEIQLIRNRAITAYALNGETFIDYNPAFERLTINECYTLLPDGRRVEPRQRAFVSQLPSSCADCGRYNHICEQAIVHTGLEPNCTVVLDYTLHRSSPIYYEHIDMQQTYPVERYDIIVDGTTLRSETDIPQNDNARLPFPVKKKDYVIDIELGRLSPPLTEHDVAVAADVVERLKSTDTRACAQAICGWVRDNIRVLHGLDMSHLDYQIAPAATVYKSGCGTPADCAGLAVAMLNRAGITATLVCDTTEPNIAESHRAAITIGNVVYSVTPTDNVELKPYGLAIDASTTTKIDSTLAWNGKEICDGYYTTGIPADHWEQYQVLPPSRTEPLSVKPCNEDYVYTIEMPKGLKMMNEEVSIAYEKKGIGSISITVKQKSRKLIVERKIAIYTTRIDAAHYADFRQMMNDWNSHRTFIVR